MPEATSCTEAERRVAALAAAGLRNKEIARGLVVEVSTVEAHLSRVYSKLGVRSRTELATRLAATGDRAVHCVGVSRMYRADGAT